MSSAGLNIEDLRQLVKKDLEASNELQVRIDLVRKAIESGQKLDSTEVSALGVEHKEIGRDLVHRIEQIEAQKSLTAADRNMLQALTARLGVHDLQSARIAELGDLLAGPGQWLKSDDIPQVVGEPSVTAVSTGDVPRGASPPAPLMELTTPSVESLELTARSSSTSLQATRGSDSAEEEEEDEDEDEYSVEMEDDDDIDSNVDKSSWPLLYRIIDIDPDTPEDVFDQRLESCYKALELRHNPIRFPNDPTAPERWNAINKAYAMLSDEGRRRFYAAHGNVPKELHDFDLSTLSLAD